jgi:hypothetical protein
MIKLRIDVDYPYSSRARSFLTVALRIKSKRSSDYLKNARILAEMINASPREIKAYWFFTPYTIPDKWLLNLLDPEHHEVGLHVANKPFEELKTLEKETGRTVKYYTIHGTQHMFARLIWGRRRNQSQAVIPKDFPLISLLPPTTITMSLDRERYRQGYESSLKDTEHWIAEGVVLSVHPEWLFERNDKTQRGPYYDVLKTILRVDDKWNR